VCSRAEVFPCQSDVDQYSHTNARRDESITVVTLKKGESHNYYRYWSRGPGHVIIHEDPYAGTLWTDYDLNQDVFLETMARITKAGWTLETSHEE
jgi:hypothetical protein